MTHRLTPTTRSLPALRWLLMVWVAFCALAFGPTQALAQDAKKDYVLGAGDVVRINVYQNQDLTLETRINESGSISYPLLGQIRLGGLSVQEAERVIATGLLKGNFLRQPQVSLLVLQVRGNQVSVLGMVNRPGRYPLETAGLRMSDLLATAGGIAIGGADVVTISGFRDGRPYRVAIDVPSLFTGQTNGQDPLVLNGDTLYVDRQPMVYIFGEVQRPGAMRLERGMTLMQALANGGGLTQRGTDKGIKVHRRSADGVVRASEPAMTETLKDGDVIQVSASLF
jgi:polysaccharide export outer membrane protein